MVKGRTFIADQVSDKSGVEFSSVRKPGAVLFSIGRGGARHSVRAVVVKQKAWDGNSGGQGTARPASRCANVDFNCMIGE